MDMRLYDAQSALSFLVSQTTIIEPQVYRTVYPDLQYSNLVPIDTAANEWATSVTFFSTDMVGQATWFNARAMDVPNADVVRSKHEHSFEMAAVGYQYDLEEINRARLVPGTNLQADRALAAKRAYEEFNERVFLRGDAQLGWTGLLNNATVTAGNVAADGTGSSPYWAAKTPAQILRDVNAQLTGIYTSSNTVETADTLLLPINEFTAISTRTMSDLNSQTIMSWLQQNNVFTQMSGQRLDIRGIRGLEDAGAGGTSRMVAYRKDPGVLKGHLPMPHRFLEVFRKGPMLYEIPGIFRTGGTEVRRPGAIRYADAIAA